MRSMNLVQPGNRATKVHIDQLIQVQPTRSFSWSGSITALAVKYLHLLIKLGMNTASKYAYTHSVPHVSRSWTKLGLKYPTASNYAPQCIAILASRGHMLFGSPRIYFSCDGEHYRHILSQFNIWHVSRNDLLQTWVNESGIPMTGCTDQDSLQPRM